MTVDKKALKKDIDKIRLLYMDTIDTWTTLKNNIEYYDEKQLDILETNVIKLLITLNIEQ